MITRWLANTPYSRVIYLITMVVLFFSLSSTLFLLNFLNKLEADNLRLSQKNTATLLDLSKSTALVDKALYLFETDLKKEYVSFDDVFLALNNIKHNHPEISTNEQLRILNSSFYNLSQQLEAGEEANSDTVKMLWDRAFSAHRKLITELALQPGNEAQTKGYIQNLLLLESLLNALHKQGDLHGEDIFYLLTRVIDTLEPLPTGELSTQILLDLLKKLRGGYYLIYNTDTHPSDVQHQSIQAEIITNHDQVINQFQILLRELNQAYELRLKQLQHRAQQAKLSVFVITTLFFIFGILLTHKLITLLKARIKALKEDTELIENGQYNLKLHTPIKDDLGRLSSSINALAFSLKSKEIIINKQVSDLKAASVHLQQANETLDDKVNQRTKELLRSQHIIDNINQGVLLCNEQFVMFDCNPAITELSGYSSQELERLSHCELFEGLDHAKLLGQLKNAEHVSLECTLRGKQGRQLACQLAITQFYDEASAAQRYVLLVSDISDKKRYEQHLQQLAFYDPLTQLANRALHIDRMQRLCAEIRRSRQAEQFALLFVDLDGFKQINDSLGHQAGDQVLTTVAARFNEVVKRHTDSVARLGGDEFAIVLHPLNELSEAEKLSRRLLSSINQPININGVDCVVGCSIGIALYPLHGEDYDSLTYSADTAMYQAKSRGRNNFVTYSPEQAPTTEAHNTQPAFSR